MGHRVAERFELPVRRLRRQFRREQGLLGALALGDVLGHHDIALQPAVAAAQLRGRVQRRHPAAVLAPEDDLDVVDDSGLRRRVEKGCERPFDDFRRAGAESLGGRVIDRPDAPRRVGDHEQVVHVLDDSLDIFLGDGRARELAAHEVEARGELAELVARQHRHLDVELAAVDARDARHQPVDRRQHAAHEHDDEAEHERADDERDHRDVADDAPLRVLGRAQRHGKLESSQPRLRTFRQQEFLAAEWRLRGPDRNHDEEDRLAVGAGLPQPRLVGSHGRYRELIIPGLAFLGDGRMREDLPARIERRRVQRAFQPLYILERRQQVHLTPGRHAPNQLMRALEREHDRATLEAADDDRVHVAPDHDKHERPGEEARRKKKRQEFILELHRITSASLPSA